jgi:hypothetical protein
MRMPRTPVRAGLAAIAVVAIVAGPAGPAGAAVQPLPGSITGGDVSSAPFTQTADEQSQSQDKAALAKAYHDLKSGAVSAAQYQSTLDGYTKRWGAAAVGAKGGTRMSRTGGSSYTASNMTSMAAAGTGNYQSSYLVFTHRAESKSFYCGPAAGEMVLRFLGDTTSYLEGTSIRQTALATSEYMNTDNDGATTYSSHHWRIGVNKWDGGSSTGYYVDNASPSGSDFEGYLTWDIDDTHPLGADTVELGGGSHYNHHPKTQTIGHWLVGYGYDNYGDTVMFDDPSTSIWGTGGSNPQNPPTLPQFTASTVSFGNTYLQSNGITW